MPTVSKRMLISPRGAEAFAAVHEGAQADLADVPGA